MSYKITLKNVTCTPALAEDLEDAVTAKLARIRRRHELAQIQAQETGQAVPADLPWTTAEEFLALAAGDGLRTVLDQFVQEWREEQKRAFEAAPSRGHKLLAEAILKDPDAVRAQMIAAGAQIGISQEHIEALADGLLAAPVTPE